MKSTRRLLSIILCLVMCLSLLPVSAFAADDIMTAAGDKTVTGRIDDQLMVWLQAQCAAAIRAGQTPVGFCGWDLLGGGFDPAGALENGQSAGALLADAGMHYFFSASSGRSGLKA